MPPFFEERTQVLVPHGFAVLVTPFGRYLLMSLIAKPCYTAAAANEHWRVLTPILPAAPAKESPDAHLRLQMLL